MPFTISLTATPEYYPVSATATTTVTVTATVINECGDPANHIEVTFSSPQAIFGPPTTVPTNHHGKAVKHFNYPFGGALHIIASIDEEIAESITVFAYSPELEQVRITNAPHNHINQYSINAGIQALIPAPIQYAAGQLFDFYWGKNARQRFIESDIGGQPYGVPWVVNIKTQFAADTVLKNGRYAVYYAIIDEIGNIAVCKPKYITVNGSHFSKLQAPVLLPASLNNRIDPAIIRQGATIRIPAQTEIKAGDLYIMTLTVTPDIDSDEPTEIRHVTSGTATATDEAIDFDITDDNGLLLGLDNVKIKFIYDIASSEDGRITQSLPLDTVITAVDPRLSKEEE